MSMKTLVLSLAIVACAATVADATAAPVCATPAERAQVADALRKGAKMLPLLGAPGLKMTEGKFMSAMGDEHRVGVQPSQFPAVWDLMRTWKDPQVTIRKEESVFLVRGPLPPGGMSVLGTAWFNLDLNTVHLTGHLRPDKVSAIYAAKVDGEGGDKVGIVFFYGQDGNEIFSVTANADNLAKPGNIPQMKAEDVPAFRARQKDPSAHEHEHAEHHPIPKEFESTFEKMKTMPRVCSAQ